MIIYACTRYCFGDPVGSTTQSLSSWLPGRSFVDPTLTSRSTHQSFRFLDLPLEVRVCIYGYLVVVGKVFYTPDKYAMQSELRFEGMNTYREPSLQILRVCKQIREEAEAIYASKNTFILPDHWLCYPPYVDVHHLTGTHFLSFFSARTLSRIKRVSLSFGGRLCSHPNTRHINAHQLHGTTHKTGKIKLALCWLHMLQQLYDPRDGSTTLYLDSLELDFTDAYCPMRWRRMLMTGSMSAKVLRPRKLRLLGLTESEECKMMSECKAYWTGRRADEIVLSEDERKA
jgi:hypothetical protein